VFEQAFKNIDDILRKDAGCTSELDYTEQSSWLLFLKYLDALERDRAMEAELEGSSAWTNCASAAAPRSTNSATRTKPRSATWATPDATAASTTRRAR
jgi:hypothetical protein